MRDWQLQDARNRFSEVVRRAMEDDPQTVTVHGQRAAFVVSAWQFDALVKPRMSFADFLLGDASGPAGGDLFGVDPWPDDVVEAINNRSKDMGSDVAF